MMQFKKFALCLNLLPFLIVKISFGNNLYDYVQKKDNLKKLRKYEKLKIKISKMEIDLTFLTNCQELNVYPKYLIFNLTNVNSYNAKFIRKPLLRSAIKLTKEELELFKYGSKHPIHRSVKQNRYSDDI